MLATITLASCLVQLTKLQPLPTHTPPLLPPTTSPSLAPTLQYVKLLSLFQIFKSSRKKYRHYITNYVLLWYFTLHTKQSNNYCFRNIQTILLYPQEVARLMEPVLFVTKGTNYYIFIIVSISIVKECSFTIKNCRIRNKRRFTILSLVLSGNTSYSLHFQLKKTNFVIFTVILLIVLPKLRISTK